MLNIDSYKEKGWLPFEGGKHYATIAMMPYRNDIWRSNAFFAQELMCEIVNIISQTEKVILCCSKKVKDIDLFCINSNVEIVNIEYDDIWARDISPFFVNMSNKLLGVNFEFNAWGGINEGSYYPWDADAKFSQNICQYLQIEYDEVNYILEGGAIATNGNGILVTTESVLLNRNRNPYASKEDFEAIFEKYFGIEKVIWIKKGFENDETDGHIDVFLNFVDEHNVFLAWTDDTSNVQYKVVRDVYQTLINECALDGKSFVVHKLQMPKPLVITKEEASTIIFNKHAILRKENTVLYPTYNNAYVFNEGVLVPIFGVETDKAAVELYKTFYKDREVYPIYSKEFLIGGGNFHCILHEIPEVKND